MLTPLTNEAIFPGCGVAGRRHLIGRGENRYRTGGIYGFGRVEAFDSVKSEF